MFRIVLKLLVIYAFALPVAKADTDNTVALAKAETLFPQRVDVEYKDESVALFKTGSTIRK